MNINRDYLIINDVKKSNVKLDNGSIFFYITDKNTQNIFVNLVINISNNDLIQKFANIENAEDYTLTMNIVKPSNTYKVIEGKLHDKEKAIFEFNLNEDCCDEIGPYRCELLTKCNINNHEEITTSNKLTYKVKSSVLNDLDDIVEAPEYPLVIQLFDKLSDIEQYEEDRRANELARQLAEEQRQTRFNTLDADMVHSMQTMDDKVVDVENRIAAKEQAVDKLINDTKADIDSYKVAKDQQINEAITNQDNKINQAITNQDNKIDTAIEEQNTRITTVESNDTVQDNRLDNLEEKDVAHELKITNIEAKDVEQDNRLDIIENVNQQQTGRLDSIEQVNTTQNNRLDSIEAVNISQGTRLDAIEIKNQQQDDRLLDVEKVNKRQDMNLKCLFAESKNNMIDVTEEGNSVYLQNSTVGYTLIDEIQGNTMVNCNKEPDKEIILNGNINTEGYSNVTLTSGVDGGLVDVALEGNTLVNVCDQKDPVAITKSYTVETGNHVALQGEYDGKCRPVVTGNTLVNLYDLSYTNVSNQAIIDGNKVKITTTTNRWSNFFNINYSIIKPNTKYTIIVDIFKNTMSSDDKIFITADAGSSDIYTGCFGTAIILDGGQTGRFVFSRTSKSDFSNVRTLLRSYFDNVSLTEGNEVELSIIILEGDYTNKPIPEYFTGLQSSFEDNLVTQEMVDSGEELADNLGKYKADYKVTGKNKFDIESITPILSSIEYVKIDNGFKIRSLTDGAYRRVTFKCKVKPNTDYFVSLNMNVIQGKFLGDIKTLNGKWVANFSTRSKFNSGNNEILMITFYCTVDVSESGEIEFTNIQIEEGSVATSYEPYKEYKKTFYLNSPLLEGDTIEQQGNNVVHVHRYGKVVLDGTNYAPLAEATLASNSYCRWSFLKIPNLANTPNSNIGIGICDKYPTVTPNNTWDNSSEGITQNNSDNKIVLYLDRYKDGSNASKQALITELQSNPATMVYKLASPQYEVISQNDTILCDSYVNGHLDVDSVVPIEKVDFLPFTNELTYLYANTQYTVQFISYAAITADITLGGAQLLAQNIVKGLNRISITTPATLANNKLIINGVGTNIMEVVVTDIDRELIYFEGMKSVGECEELQVISINSDRTLLNTQRLTHEPLRGTRDAKDRYVLIDGKWYIERKCGIRAYQEGDKDNYKTDLVNTVYPLEMPTYEEIDYNPLEVYSGTTHITTNSVIPCNITVKNHGFNCLLKPSTTYTISSNLGLNTVTTPSTLTEDCLRFMDTDTSDVTTMKDVLVLEGDYTTGKPLPSHFSGIESAFEQEYDEVVGKYKVKIRVQNEDASKENYIEFYISKPLRGIGDVKDKVYVKDDKVVVERKCGQRAYQDGDFGTYLTDKVNTVYALAEPTYEEVEYNDTKLFIESFKNSTLFYNSNVPVTSKLHYSYSVPIVDTVAQTANVTDQQDSMIIDLATQVAVMEMMLM